MAGGEPAFRAFQDLMQLLLDVTVLSPGQAVRVAKQAGTTTRVLGNQGRPTSPVLLRDGRWLRIAVSLELDDGGTKGRLKVVKSSFQYQADEEGEQEICRYDYLRQPGTDPHPQAHLNVHGTLQHYPLGAKPLARIHFPTGRISLEAVIRLLVEQFDVPTKHDSNVWRPVLSCTENAFAEIAHRPASGPAS